MGTKSELKLLAFDLGASNGRAVMGSFDGEALKLEEIHRFSNDPVYAAGSLYWDTLRQLHEIKTGLQKCCVNNKALAGMGIDTWGVDFGLIGPSGELLGNALHYRDSATDGIVEKVLKAVPAEEIYAPTGIQFMKFNTLFQLWAMKQRSLKALDVAETMLFTPDLMSYFLTGVKVSEYSIASTSQMLDAEKGTWSFELIRKFGIPEKILADIVQPGTVLGNVLPDICNELKVPNVPVIAVAGHDTASAVAAVPAENEDFVYISCGTWSLMGTELKRPVINDRTLSMQFTNEGGYGHTIRLLKNIIGLWIVQECVRDWNKEGETVSFAELDRLTIKAKPLVSLINPDHEMFMSPGDMPAKVRKFCKDTNQLVPEGKGEVARCVIESLALKYRVTVEKLEELMDKSASVIHMVGGGIKDRLLCKFTADSTSRRVFAGPIEATAIGNLLVQAIALGKVSNLSEAREIVRKSFPVDVYEPENREQWDEAYERFVKLCR